MAPGDGDEPSLFDLPLAPDGAAEEEERGAPARDAPARQLPDLEPPDLPEPAPPAAQDDTPAPAPRPQPVPAPFTSRLAASLLDGGVLIVCAAAVLLGGHLLGVGWERGDLPALALFLAVFSFVYSVVPLAFWGRTPGMALMRVISRGADGGPLTFGQTALRWLGGLVTVALAGLPLLLVLAGRSPADLLSGSRTWLQPPAPEA